MDSAVEYPDQMIRETMAGGVLNTDHQVILDNIRHAIRQGHVQVRPDSLKTQRIVLLGSGPSLNESEDEIRKLLWEGNTTLVTLNGAYHWAIEHKLRPNVQIVMDARDTNVRFVQPPVPECRYLLASQCSPTVWASVKGRPGVWIFHAVMRETEPEPTAVLDEYYMGNWAGVNGGTSVATRAMFLLRMLGYVQYDLFGVDCCWKGAEHHALAQPENEQDKKIAMNLDVVGHEPIRFWVSAWHLKQFEDFMTIFKLTGGQHWMLNVHGGGLLAHAIRLLGTDTDFTLTEAGV